MRTFEWRAVALATELPVPLGEVLALLRDAPWLTDEQVRVCILTELSGGPSRWRTAYTFRQLPLESEVNDGTTNREAE